MLTHRLEAYGVSFAVTADSEFLLNTIESRLPPFSKPAPPLDGQRLYCVSATDGVSVPGYSLTADDEEICRDAELEVVLDRFESHVQLHVAETSPHYIFLHAGVVAWAGGAILLPGRTFNGKSTLVAELVRQGAGYYSDEYAVLDPAGRVHAYPRPIGLRQIGDRGVVRQRVEQPAPAGGYSSLPVRAVFLCVFRAGSAWKSARLPRGKAALALVSHVVSARRTPGRTLACLSQLATRSPVFVAERGDAVDAGAHILSSCRQLA